MGKNIDKTMIQIKMLNTSKGPAVHSLRAQADKKMYSISMTQVMGNTPNLILRQGEVTEILVEDGKIKGVKTYSGAVYYAKAVVIATGASPRPIGCPGEKEFTGKGVSYCATCDANFFEDFEVYVVGGGDSAVEEAMYLTKFARKVTLVHRRDELRAAKSIQEKAFANPKMAFMWNTTIEEIKGDGVVTSMIVKDTKTGETREIEADEEDGTFGIFVFVGFDPKSQLFEGKLEMENRYIVTDKYMHTSVPGVFAAGDVIVKHLRQVVTACGDGAVAATEAQHYVENLAD